MKRLSPVVATVLCAVMSGITHAEAISTGGTVISRENKGLNTVGVASGDVIDVVAANVNPNLTTSGFVTNPQVAGSYTLFNQFTSVFGFGNRNFVATIPGAGSTVTSPWTLQLQNRANTLTLNTSSLAGLDALPLLGNLVASGSPLAPTLTWDPVVTTTPYSQVLLRIYDNRTNQVILNDTFIGAPGTTSHSIPEGLLAPNVDYTFRVILQDSPGGGVVNRSSTFVNYTTTSANVSVGALVQAGGGSVAPVTLSTGVNDFAGSSINIGVNTAGGAGAATLGSGTTLTSTFLNVGLSNFGTMNVDNTSVTLNGGIVDDGTNISTNGGFLTVGRVAGGRGFLNVTSGGRIDINSAELPQPGLNIGRETGSFGNVLVSGAGSTIAIAGPSTVSATPAENGLINVGRAGDGRLTIANGGQVLNSAAGVTNIGWLAGSRGSALVTGSGSLLDAGSQLNVGPSGGGEGLLQIANGGLVRAGATTVGAGGVLMGSGGTLQSDVTITGGAFLPGSSPGKMTIIGDLFLTEGLLLLEANGDGPGEFDEVDVSGQIVIGPNMTIEILLGYTPTSPLSFLTAGDEFLIDDAFEGPQVFALLGSGVQNGTMVQIAFGDTIFDVMVQAPVPVPATLVLLAIGLLGLATARRRKVLH